MSNNNHKDKPKLKIGFFLDSFNVHAWIYEAIIRVFHTNNVEVSLVIMSDFPNDHKNKSLWDPQTRKQGWLIRFFSYIDTSIFIRKNNALEIFNIETLFSDTPILRVSFETEKKRLYLSHEDLTRVQNAQLDILVSFVNYEIDKELLVATKYGGWKYCFGEQGQITWEYAGYWEVIQDISITSVGLYTIGDENDFHKALYHSNITTYPFSVARNRNTILWKASTLLTRQLDLLFRLGEQQFEQEISKPIQSMQGIDRNNKNQLSSLAVFINTLNIAGKIGKEMLTRLLFRDTWYLLFSFDGDPKTDIQHFNPIMPYQDRFWADPQIIQRNNNYYIFIEEYIYEQRKGHISVIEMDGEGNWRKPFPVLVSHYHLSYPFVFQHQSDFFMIPESSENKTIDLYQCDDFPTGWRHKKTIMSGIHAVDTTVFFYQGRWWLFTGICDPIGTYPNVELFIFFADSLFTNHWTPHPLNPVASDVTSARAAGKIFEKDGKLFRPSQDCSKTYGYSFSLNEIVCLSEATYHEEEAITVLPDWNQSVLATHTYNREGNLTFIDAFMRKPRFLQSH